MKNKIKLLLLIILMIPLSTYAAVMRNYNSSNVYKSQYINKFNGYQRYILTGKSGMINKEEFLSTLISGRTYLTDGKEYWTNSVSETNGEYQYFISSGLNTKSRDGMSGLRVTEYIKSGVNVKGNGTYNTPWEFVESYSIKITPSINDSGININYSSALVSKGSNVKVTITEPKGYSYTGKDDCGLSYKKTSATDPYTKEYEIKNVNKDINCVAKFEKRIVTVKYNCGTGSGSPSNQKFVYNDSYTLRGKVCTKSKYEQSRWLAEDGSEYSLGETGTWNINENVRGVKNNILMLTADYIDKAAPNVKITAYQKGTTTQILNGKSVVSYTPTTSNYVNSTPFILNDNLWFNKQVTLKVEVSDDSNIKSIVARWDGGDSQSEPNVNATNHAIASNLTTNTYSFNQDINKEGFRVIEFEVVDVNGNKSVITVKAKMDLTKPTCSLKTDGSNITFASKDDAMSGLNAYDLTKSSSASYNNVTSLSASTGTYYGYVKDNAGNTNSCSLIVDKTAPTVKITAYQKGTTTPILADNSEVTYTPTTSSFTNSSPFILNKGNWFNKQVTLKVEVSDASNLKSIVARWDGGNSTTEPSVNTTNHEKATNLTTNTYTFNQDISTQGFRVLEFEAVDDSGNKSVITVKAKIDLTKPTCTLKYDSGNVVFDSKTDAMSGLNSYDLTKSSTATYAKHGSVAFAASTTFYGYTKDNAGNTNSCTYRVNFTPHYRIGNTLYETLNTAFAGASSGNTIYLLVNYTDSSTATTSKNITIDLDGKTLIRTKGISTTGGTMSIKNGAIVSNTSFDLLNGEKGNLVIDDVDMTCGRRCIYNDSGTKGTGNITIRNGSKLISDKKQPIRVVSGGTTTITDSFIYNKHRSETAVSIGNSCGNVTVNGNSIIGMGYENSDGDTTGNIGAGITNATSGLTITMDGNAQIMIGRKGGDGIYGGAKTNVVLKGSSSIYTLGNGDNISRACVSIGESGTGSSININTSGYLYANGYNTVLIKFTTGSISFSKGHLVSKLDKEMFEINRGRSYTAQSGPGNRKFNQIKNSNGEVELVTESNCYYYAKGV